MMLKEFYEIGINNGDIVSKFLNQSTRKESVITDMAMIYVYRQKYAWKTIAVNSTSSV